MTENQLPNNITAYRKKKALSQEKLAELMGVSRQAVTKWESGNSKPSSENLIKLAELLEITLKRCWAIIKRKMAVTKKPAI
ncbi:MAG: helix-turn-helix transcriptional regulator [Ruminococcaceae bacterium]|nr:helix-turn-helix transcriptional regulator [Oscillospiraceae bacterium]